MQHEQTAPEKSEKRVTLLTIFLVFLKVGAFTFGGGYAILPVIQREAIVKHKWVDRDTFFDILIITQSMPGALALNSAIQIGMRLRGVSGGVIAALGVITPSVLIILLIVALFLPVYRDNVYVQAIFYGLRPAVVALIAAAAFSLGREMLRGWISAVMAAVLLAATVLLRIHPIAVLVIGGAAGLILFRKKDV
ncbi:MAG: chromate transporter [Bacillota bacterium]